MRSNANPIVTMPTTEAGLLVARTMSCRKAGAWRRKTIVSFV